MGLTFADLQGSQWKQINAEANRIYMLHREEFETTCVCRPDGEVVYLYGKAPDPVMPKGVKFTAGGGIVLNHTVPEWRIEQKKRYDADRLRTYEQAKWFTD